MIKSSTNVIGIIFPNSYDALVPELVSVRLMASIPFASRYRIIDFILSSKPRRSCLKRTRKPKGVLGFCIIFDRGHSQLTCHRI